MRMDIPEHIEVIRKCKEKITYYAQGKLIYLTVSGSHLYGFNSEDSDIDYRGTYITNTNNLIGIKKPKESMRFMEDDNMIDIDLFEIKKEIILGLQGNCNVLEQLNAKPIWSSAEHIQLRNLINDTIGKDGVYKSYRGMAYSNYNKFIKQGKNTVKKYLYVFRGLMAGTYYLETGVIEPNIYTLNRYFKIPVVKELIKIKKLGNEKMKTPKSLDSGMLEEKVTDMFSRIDNAYDKNTMPEHPTDEGVEDVAKFLRGLRRRTLR